MKRLVVLAVAMLWSAEAAAQDPVLLVPDGVIALPDTAGRIDHLAVDLARKHLFIAELGNNTVDVIDLNQRKVIHRITGLSKPQGIAYEPKTDLVAVANGDDGTVRFYAGADFAPRGAVALGEGADNIRIDTRNGYLVVGYGDGALGIIDPARRVKLRDIALPSHPESFRLSGSRAFVNVPGARGTVVADMDTGKITGKWVSQHQANFPMILDASGHAAIVFRAPARIALFEQATGKIGAVTESCGDSDDVFFDAARKLFYVSCGDGTVDVFSNALEKLSSTPTAWGARTSLFVPELDRLFVAERAGLLQTNAALLILRPAGR